MYARVEYAAGGLGFGLLTLSSFEAGQWPWKVLLGWIVVGILIMSISIVMFTINDRRFQNERRIAALQTLPLPPEV
jgi:hypothetical protein